MGDTTEISWCDKTFNPWGGCQKVGPGCDNCYAETRNKRYSGKPTAPNWGPGAPRRRTSVQNWNKPKRWNREATDARPRVFCASLADVFDNQVANAWRSDLWSLMDECPNLDWLIVTKRVGNVKNMVPDHWKENWPSNVWLLTTVCNQEEADRDIPKLINLKDHFGINIIGLSMEPLLGPVGLRTYLADLDWVIVGGEDGPRPVHPDWVRDLRDHCAQTHTPFHFKQWGAWHTRGYAFSKGVIDKPFAPVDGERILAPWGDKDVIMARVGKKKAGCLLDGVEYKEFPA